MVAQRMYLHKSKLFRGVILLDAAYNVPTSDPFDLGAINQASEATVGYPNFAYWEFFLSADCVDTVDQNLERMWHAIHGDVAGWPINLFCARGALRNFLLGSEEVPVKEYAKQHWKDGFMNQFKSKKFAPSLQLYKSTASNIQCKSDSTIPKKNLVMNVPIKTFQLAVMDITPQWVIYRTGLGWALAAVIKWLRRRALAASIRDRKKTGRSTKPRILRRPRTNPSQIRQYGGRSSTRRHSTRQ